MTPSSPTRSVSRKELPLLLLLLALYAAVPWVVRPLEAWWPAPRVASIGQVAELLLGLILGAWTFALIRRTRRLAHEQADLIEHLTQTDALTGLGNLRAFARELELALNRARRTREPVALVFLDVVSLEHLNRRHGRPIGDQTLRMMGAVLRSSARFGSDCGYRVGDDEFALVVSARRDIADAVGRRIESNFQARSPRNSQARCIAAGWDGRASAHEMLEQARRTLATTRDGSLASQLA
jgi:diguanylate cyclase (GGDEF)-like protein